MWFHLPGGLKRLYMLMCAFVGGWGLRRLTSAACLALSLALHRLQGVTLPFFSDRSSPPFITYMGHSHSL